MAVFKIPARNLAYLSERVEKMNKRAAKVGADIVKTHVLNFTPDRWIQTMDGERYIPAKYEIELEGLAPKMAGWGFVGTVEHTDHGNILRAFPGQEIPELFRNRGRFCDHCQKSRFRKDTYIVKSESGDFKQVGHSCVLDFTGGMSPEYFAHKAQWLGEIERLCDEDGFSGCRTPLCETTYFFEVAAQRIIEKGYHKGLGSGAYWFLTKPPKPRFKKSEEPPPWIGPVTKEARLLAQEAFAWGFNGMDTETPFNKNIHIALQKAEDSNFVEKRDAGILAYLIEAYRKDVQKVQVEKAVKIEQPVSEWKGEVGARITWASLTVSRCIPVGGAEPLFYLNLFVDAQGNEFKWATGKKLDAGQTFEVTGTVKKFEEFKGRKQTVLTRCSIQEVA